MPVTDSEPEIEEIRKVLQTEHEKEDEATCERWRALQTSMDSRTDSVVLSPSDSLTRDSFYETTPVNSSLESDQSFVAESEVLYNEGATPLFRSIEESDWAQAAKILEQNPEQASVWVKSTGTVSTTFNWSLWRRLPLHEAARRQPPERFIAKLIHAYPAATSRTTHFGELALHLAAECGADPAVVHLLALHNWPGVAQTDQSGRVALDILVEAALLDPVDQTEAQEALKVSLATYGKFKKQKSKDLEGAEKQHRIGLRALR